MKRQSFAADIGVYVLILATLGFLLFGYFANIGALIVGLNSPITLMMVLRAIGIAVPPLGVILGYF